MSLASLELNRFIPTGLVTLVNHIHICSAFKRTNKSKAVVSDKSVSRHALTRLFADRHSIRINTHLHSGNEHLEDMLIHEAGWKRLNTAAVEEEKLLSSGVKRT